MAIFHVTDAAFNNQMQTKGLTLVNFWAPWCGPCRMFATVLEAYVAEGNHDVKILKLNVDEETDVANQFGVMSLPTSILFKDGEPIDKVIGALPLSDLKKFVTR